MTLTPEQEAVLERWWVIRELKKLSINASPDQSIEFKTDTLSRPDDLHEPAVQVKVNIINILERLGAIVIRDRDYGSLKSVKTGKKIYDRIAYNPLIEKDLHWKPVRYFIKIIQPKFEEVYSEYSDKALSAGLKNSVVTEQTQSIQQGLVWKDGEGKYRIKDNVIEVNSNSIYYQVFDILFTRRNQDGFLSYEAIDKYLAELRDEKNIETTSQIRKKIQNAISTQQGFFKYAKVNGQSLKNKNYKGEKLVDIVPGKGLKLNN